MIKGRIAIFASGGGSNAEAILTYFAHHPSIEVSLILSNNANAFVLQRAKAHGIPEFVFTRPEYIDGTAILKQLQSHGITHIVLAGFLWLIPSYLLERYPDRIVNIHPALLPQFGGKGMFGMKVHEAVKAAGSKETGITIHLVNEHYDDGRILFQGRCVVEDDCTAEEIARRVLELEHLHYPRIIQEWIESQIGREEQS